MDFSAKDSDKLLVVLIAIAVLIALLVAAVITFACYMKKNKTKDAER